MGRLRTHGTISRYEDGTARVCEGRLKRLYVRDGGSWIGVGAFCTGCGVFLKDGRTEDGRYVRAVDGLKQLQQQLDDAAGY